MSNRVIAVSRREFLHTTLIGSAASLLTACVLPASADGSMSAVIVNSPRGSHGKIAGVEVRVFDAKNNNISWDSFVQITRQNKCHVGCWSTSQGYSTRQDTNNAWPTWFGDRMSFDFLCSSRSQDDNIYAWFSLIDSATNKVMCTTQKMRIALG